VADREALRRQAEQAELYLHHQAVERLLAADRAALLRAADRLVYRLAAALPGGLRGDLAALAALAGLDPQAVPPRVAGQPEADLTALDRAADQHLSVVLPALPLRQRVVLADRVARCLAAQEPASREG